MAGTNEDQLRLSVEALLKMNKELKEENEELKKINNKKENERVEALNKCLIYLQRIDELNFENKQLQEENLTLNACSVIADAGFEDYTKQVEHLKQQKDEWVDKFNGQLNKNMELKEENDKFKTRLDKLVKEILGLPDKEENAKLREKNAKLHESINRYWEKLTKFGKEIADLKFKNRVLESKITNQKNEYEVEIITLEERLKLETSGRMWCDEIPDLAAAEQKENMRLLKQQLKNK